MYSFKTPGDWYDFAANKPGAKLFLYYLPYYILGRAFTILYDDAKIYQNIYNIYNNSLSEWFYYKFCEGLTITQMIIQKNDGIGSSKAIYRRIDQDMRCVGLWLSLNTKFEKAITQLQILVASKYDCLQKKPITRNDWGKFKTECWKEFQPYAIDMIKKTNWENEQMQDVSNNSGIAKGIEVFNYPK